MLKQKEVQNFRREGGITLIALIITIIILVILAAVSINAVYNSGIIDYTVNGTEKYIKESEIERLQLLTISTKMGNGLYQELNQTNLQNAIDSEYGSGRAIVKSNGNGNFTIKFNNPVREYSINNSGKVVNLELIDDDLSENNYLKTFITEWTVEANDNIILPIYEMQAADEERGEKETYFNYNFIVDYGDGTEPLQITSFDDEDREHTYLSSGTYDVKITGICEGWSFSKVNTSAGKIRQIKQWGVIDAKHIDFYQCSNLTGSIPVPSKNSFTKIESFRLLFMKCENLKSQIPENLFYNARNLVTCRNCFDSSGVTGTIPGNLFNYCIKIENVAYVFGGCKNLTGSIPENLFENCISLTTVKGVFSTCSGLTGSIPENLLHNCPEITDVWQLFYKCSGLTGSIPEKLFEMNTKITNINQTFRHCSGLTGSIPENLFINLSEITDVRYCFDGCTNISDSTIKFTSKNITQTEQFSAQVIAYIVVLIPEDGTFPSSFGLTHLTVETYSE